MAEFEKETAAKKTCSRNRLKMGLGIVSQTFRVWGAATHNIE